jgi:PD-(D/E)XK nuclease superfamily protein
MTPEIITIYKLDGSSFERPKDECIFTQRSAIVSGKCPRKRYLSYHSGPERKGVQGNLTPDHFELGSAVHFGLETLFGEDLDPGHAGIQAWDYFMDQENLLLAEDPWIEQVAPEMAEEIKLEQAYLARGLVECFERKYLSDFLSQYEIISLEEEINWEVGTAPDGRTIVMMSRLDGVCRGREDKKLYVISHKTTKKIWDDLSEKLSIDPQQFTEGLALQAKYGEPPGGTIYLYFIKGERKKDQFGYKKYETSLVRPWYYTASGKDNPRPEQFAWVGKWSGKNGSKGSSLGQGWERTNVWELIEYSQWLDWLESGLIQPNLERDWLSEQVATPMVEIWSPLKAQDFLEELQHNEWEWNSRVETGVPSRKELNWLFPKVRSVCHDYNQRCPFWDICHGTRTVESGLASGRWIGRISNHKTEDKGE